MPTPAATAPAKGRPVPSDHLQAWVADPQVLALAERLRELDRERVPLETFGGSTPLLEAWQRASLCQPGEGTTVHLTPAGRALVYGLSEYRRWQGTGGWQEAVLFREVGLQPGAVILDVGCGAGAHLIGLLSLAPRLLMGVDPEPVLLRLAGAVAALECGRMGSAARTVWILGRAEALPVAAGAVDAVFSRNAFHLLQTGQALAELARVLRPGGTAVIQFHDWRFYGRRLAARRVRRLLPDTVMALLLGTILGWTGRQRQLALGGRCWSEVYHSIPLFRRLGAALGLSVLRSVPGRGETCPTCVFRKHGTAVPHPSRETQPVPARASGGRGGDL